MSRALLVIGLLLVPLAPAASGGSTFDWVLAEIALPQGASAFSVSVGATGSTGADSVPYSIVWSIRGWVAGYAFDGEHAPTHATLSGGAGTHRVDLTAPEERGAFVGFGLGVWSADASAATARVLMVAPGLAGTGHTVSAADGNGAALAVNVITGSGADAVRVGDLTNGLGASVGAASAGSGSANRAVPDGIVGAMTLSCAAGPCTSTWSSPDGRQGTWSQLGQGLGTSAGGDGVFGGPAGSWSWSWQGVQTGDVVGVYAPIGAAAAHFR